MTNRYPTRRLLASFVCLLVVSPTIAGWAHDRAHHLATIPHANAPDDDEHEHGHQAAEQRESDHQHGLPPAGSEASIGRDHADSTHQLAAIESGTVPRMDLAVAVEASVVVIGSPRFVRIASSVHPPDPWPHQTHHPPSLPRGPPAN